MYVSRIVKSLLAVSVVLCLLVGSVLAYDDVPPDGSDYTGSCYLVGNTVELGSVTVYLPVSYRTGYLGFTSSGNLRNVSNSTISGILFAGSREYDVRWSSWSTPQYRDTYGSDYYQYEDLTFTSVDYSNMEIADEFPPLVGSDTVFQWIPVFLLGVIILCLFMKRF